MGGTNCRTWRALAAVALALGLVATGSAGTSSAGAAPSASRAPAAGCSLTSTGGTVTRTIWMGWSTGFRSYNLRVPAGLSGSAPLLIDMHGFQSFPFGQELTTGWSQFADTAKFVVAYPAGNWNTWDVNEGSADVTFIRAVVAQIQSRYCIDSRRIFAEGGSLGGWMAQRLACDADDLFAAVVGTSAGPTTFFGSDCNPDRPIAVGLVHGESDPLILPSLGAQARDQWIARNGCSTTPTNDPNPFGTGVQHGGCNGGVHVMWRTYAGVGHAYPSGAALDDFHTKVWAFLLAHPRP